MTDFIPRRSFFKTAGLGLAGLGFAGTAGGKEDPIPGMEDVEETTTNGKEWQPVSDRKIRVGIAGYGFCRFGAAFGFQKHPNVAVVAVTDLVPDRCAGLAKECQCKNTYPSLEEMVNDIIMALNMTVSGIVAHQSALRNGELLKIPQYSL